MDVQRSLLSKIIHDKTIATAVSSKITEEFFPDDHWRRVYAFLVDHWRRYAQPPDIDVVTHAFPSYEWPVEKQPTSYLVNELRKRRKGVIATEALSDAIVALNTTDDPDHLDRLFDILTQAILQVRLETNPALDGEYGDESDAQIALVEERTLDPGYLRGISSGYRGIDYVTGGFQPEQLVVLIGLPKAFKTSTMVAMCKAVHGQAKVPFFASFEMSQQEVFDCLHSLFSGVSRTKILNGTISLREQREIEKGIRLAKAGKRLILSADLAGMTVSGVQAKIMEYQPDVVFVDAAYLMVSELSKVEQGSPQALTDIARSLKRLAQSMSIPIVVSTQASMTRSKQGLNIFSPMYTQAWAQSADVLLGVERVDPEAPDIGPAMVKFKVLASRSGPRGETLLMWDWAHGSVKEVVQDDRRPAHELN